MDKIRSHRDLKVWNKAMDAAMAVFEVTKNFPSEEKFSLTDQVRRSSRSTPAQISEAWRKRRYSAASTTRKVKLPRHRLTSNLPVAANICPIRKPLNSTAFTRRSSRCWPRWATNRRNGVYENARA